MFKKLYISLIFSNLVVTKSLNSNHRMHNLYANFVKILDVCKSFSTNLVNELGNLPRPGVVPKFSDLEVIALNLTAENMSIDSENYLFALLEDYHNEMPDLISRHQYNDRRKYTADLCERIRKRIVESLCIWRSPRCKPFKCADAFILHYPFSILHGASRFLNLRAKRAYASAKLFKLFELFLKN